MSFYLPPLNVDATFNLSDYNYQYENINYITGDQRYSKISDLN